MILSSLRSNLNQIGALINEDRITALEAGSRPATANEEVETRSIQSSATVAI